MSKSNKQTKHSWSLEESHFTIYGSGLAYFQDYTVLTFQKFEGGELY